MHIKAMTDTLKELFVIYVVLLLVSGGLFAAVEGRGFIESIYWAGTTATSTGYGDISPQTMTGRIIAFVLMHISIFFIAPLVVVRLINHVNEDRDKFSHEEQEALMAKMDEVIRRLDALEGRSR